MTESPIDRSVFVELQDAMGSEFVEELVNTFLDEAPGMLAELKSAAESGEQDIFRRAAHSLKSNANIFGARELAELARQMEISGLEPEPAQIDVLNAEFKRTATTLKDMLDE
jgi:HPt (histidine-containing phosphotransfer) domain-containing protein